MKSKKPLPSHAPIELGGKLQTVRVSRPKGVTTVVNGADDIDVRDGSLMLLTREANGRETCVLVFGPGQWISANVDPV
jgi:hypothetical protein